MNKLGIANTFKSGEIVLWKGELWEVLSVVRCGFTRMHDDFEGKPFASIIRKGCDNGVIDVLCSELVKI